MYFLPSVFEGLMGQCSSRWIGRDAEFGERSRVLFGRDAHQENRFPVDREQSGRAEAESAARAGTQKGIAGSAAGRRESSLPREHRQEIGIGRR